MQKAWAKKFLEQTGSNWYLSKNGRSQLIEYLKHQQYLMPGERLVYLNSAGEGNMNLTLRVMTNHRQFIVKQSRPWVAKFPDLEAPVERIHVERAFFLQCARNPVLSLQVPELLRSDLENYTLFIEDLGTVQDLTSFYVDRSKLSAEHLSGILHFASHLHRVEPPKYPDNRGLLQLNHAHVFDLPFRTNNGFPLDAIYPGLAAVALPFQRDETLRQRAAELGRRYLTKGNALIHGDFYPGSFLDSEGKVFVIDGEFSCLGPPEFDTGVLKAHLLMGRAPTALLDQLTKEYTPPPGYNPDLAEDFCHVEVIRRLIGIAQLPINLDLDERRRLLEKARIGLLRST